MGSEMCIRDSSSLIGIAARTSIETGETVKIRDLVEIPPVWPG